MTEEESGGLGAGDGGPGPQPAKACPAARLKPSYSMKHIVTILTLALGILSATPVEARAGHHDSSEGWVEYRKVRRIVGHTRIGHHPIYRWKTIRIYHSGREHFGGHHH